MTHSQALRDILRLDATGPALMLTPEHRQALRRAIDILDAEERARRSDDDTQPIGGRKL